MRSYEQLAAAGQAPPGEYLSFPAFPWGVVQWQDIRFWS